MRKKDKETKEGALAVVKITVVVVKSWKIFRECCRGRSHSSVDITGRAPTHLLTKLIVDAYGEISSFSYFFNFLSRKFFQIPWFGRSPRFFLVPLNPYNIPRYMLGIGIFLSLFLLYNQTPKFFLFKVNDDLIVRVRVKQFFSHFLEQNG